tara:strand:+ start:71617 stop:74454 length:2838 start_codon:yes stop_codon:yes gene_type:complete
MKKIYSLILSVILASGFYSQSLTAITPSSANQGETLDVTITGQNTNFSQASSTSLSLYFEFNQSSSTINVSNILASDDNTLTASISVPEDETLGSYDLIVYNNVDGNLSLAGGFEITETPPSGPIYVEDFESATGGNLPDGWTQVTNATDGGYSTSSDLTSQYFNFPAHTQYVGTNDDLCDCDKSDEQLISNLISLPSNTIPVLTFEYILGQYYGEYAEVAVSTDGGTTNTVLSTLTATNPGGTHTWESHSVDLSAYAGQDINLVWIYQDNDGWGSGLMIDDVSIAEVTCGQVTDLSLSDLSFSSATISWNAGASANSYNVEYGAAGFELGSGMQEASSETSFTLTDLDGQTNYDFYVQSDCGDSDLSSWTGPFSFTTLPAPVACGDVVEHCYDVGSYIVFTASVENPGDVIGIDIIAGETEVGYDNLQIWDGVGNTGNLLYDADGDHAGVMIISNTGTITMYIEGDGNYNCVDGLGGPYVPFEVNVNCFTPAAVDMELTELTMESLVVAGANNITGTVTSYGTDPITSIDIAWNDGSGANTETFSVNMNFGDTYDFTHSTPLNTVGGETYNVEVTVSATGDADESNNTISTTVSTVSSLVTKVVVGEEKTGEWCGWCPRGAVGLAEAYLSNPDDFIGIAIHNGDAMAVASYDGNIGDYIPGGYPGGGVDRVIAGDPSEFTAMYNARKSLIVPASVEASGTYDDNTITVDVTASFVGSLSGDYRLAAVILEDSVAGAGQVNYYAGGNYGPMTMPNTGSMPNFEFGAANSPSTVSPFYHDHVARALGDDEINGAVGSLPSTNTDGDIATHTYTFNRNNNWNVDKLHVVGMLVNGATGEILNAGKGNVININSVSISENNYELLNVFTYPNPSSGLINLSIDSKHYGFGQVKVFNVLGEEIYNNRISKNTPGNHITQLDLSNSPSGIYFATVSLEGEQKTVRFNITK